MDVFNTIEGIQGFLAKKWQLGARIGFVPTMGALHAGHLSLLQHARRENDLFVCSIFVNPIQFNNKNDLEKYPRVIESDLKLLQEVSCDVVFHPSEQEMYPEPPDMQFDLGELDKVMEGLHRPGHFNGVAIVVSRLFDIVKPTNAYFGMKDYQQLVVIHKIVKDQKLPIEIVPCLTVREKDGLAMSSRNRLLSPIERKEATLIYDTLKTIKMKSGFLPLSHVKTMVENTFKKNKTLRLEYCEVVDMLTLKPLKHWTDSHQVIACIAAYAGKVRLIDNIVLFS